MSWLHQISKRIIKQDGLERALYAPRKVKLKIVFTNGCFDILHKGHVEYLAKAADLGDILVVGVNSDASVKRQGKGDERPINDFEARATLLSALAFVDVVVEFDDDTPIDLIKEVMPDVLVKGGDYNPEQEDASSKDYIVGREIVLKNGGKVEVIEIVPGYSTTGILDKLQK